MLSVSSPRKGDNHESGNNIRVSGVKLSGVKPQHHCNTKTQGSKLASQHHCNGQDAELEARVSAIYVISRRRARSPRLAEFEARI